MGTKKKKSTNIGIWIVALVVAGILIFAFVQKYQGTSAGSDGSLPLTKPEVEVGDTCQNNGKKCVGKCNKEGEVCRKANEGEITDDWTEAEKLTCACRASEQEELVVSDESDIPDIGEWWEIWKWWGIGRKQQQKDNLYNSLPPQESFSDVQ